MNKGVAIFIPNYLRTTFKEIVNVLVMQVLRSNNDLVPTKKLEELAHELSLECTEDGIKTEVPLKVIKKTDLECIIPTIKGMTDEFCKIEHDWEQSLNVK